MAKYRILEGCTSASSTALALKMNGGMPIRSCSSSSSSVLQGPSPHYADGVRELSARQRIREMQQTTLSAQHASRSRRSPGRTCSLCPTLSSSTTTAILWWDARTCLAGINSSLPHSVCSKAAGTAGVSFALYIKNKIGATCSHPKSQQQVKSQLSILVGAPQQGNTCLSKA